MFLCYFLPICGISVKSRRCVNGVHRVGLFCRLLPCNVLIASITDFVPLLPFAKENLDSSTATGKLMLTMIGAINEYERANLLERQREGIAIAVQDGKYKGRQTVEIDDFASHYDRYMSRQISKSALAKELNISRPTLDRLIKQREETRTE